MSIFEGSAVAISTPFTQNGVNFKIYEELLEFQLHNGTDAIVVCGTTGEPSTMTIDEQDSLIEFTVKKVAKKIPVIAGTGGNNTAECVVRSRRAQELGADALLIVTPYYNKATQDGIVEHYKAIAQNVSLPIIVYNVPVRTGLNVLPKTMRKLAEIENVAAIKEASANIAQIVEMARLAGDGFDIYSGNDDHVVPVMSVGGKGVISVAANIAPKEMHDIARLYLDGNVKESCARQLRINPLINALFTEVNPIPVKTALSMMGYDMGDVRLPLTNLTEKNRAVLREEMIKFGIKVKV